MSLWEKALDKAKSKEAGENTLSQQSNLLFVGAKSSGKTTIINRFLEKEESLKPTVALEYTFGRKSKGHSAKDVAHVWELGGGMSMVKLLGGTLDQENVGNTAVVLVVDLSDPSTIWSTVQGLLAAIAECVNRVIESAPKELKLKNQLRERRKEQMQLLERTVRKSFTYRYGVDDAQMISAFPLPLTIIGGKFDQFQEKVSLEKRKVAASTLRFLAHYHNANLYFFSVSKQEQAVAKLRAHFNHLAFGAHTEAKDYLVDLTKPFIITAGRDSFAKIGGAAVSDGDYNRLAARTPIELWEYAFYQNFPDDKHKKPLGPPPNPTVDPNDQHKFDEAAVDRARTAKDDELDKYKRISDRKMRDLMQQAINEGINVQLMRN